MIRRRVLERRLSAIVKSSWIGLSSGIDCFPSLQQGSALLIVLFDQACSRGRLTYKSAIEAYSGFQVSCVLRLKI